MEKQNEENFTFVWIIKNFSMCIQSKKEYFCSPLFELNSLPGMKWCIKLYPRGNSDKNYVATYLSREDNLPEACKVSFSIHFLDCNEKEIPTIITIPTTTNVFDKKAMDWGYAEFIERNVVLRSLMSDILVIKYTLKPLSESNDEEILPAIPYNSGLFTDVLLRARGAEFKLQKAMLWARWPELAKKLEQEKSSEEDFDIGSNVLEAMIKYVYTEKLDPSTYLFFEELWVTAAKYGLRIPYAVPRMVKISKTRISADKISFLWPIENFSSLPVNAELYHEFKMDIPEFSKWSLNIHIREKTETEQIFSIFICKISDNEFKPIFIRTKVSFDISDTSQKEHFFKKNEKWKCAEFSRNISTDPGDVLLLKCEFKMSDGSFSSETVESSCVFANTVGDSNLNKNLRNLYETGKFSDIDIKVGSKTLSAHKFILCARSSVFSKMFDTEMMEAKKNILEISDIDPDVMHEFLFFMYCGSLEKLCEETAMQLYAAADKYDVSALKKVCSSFLKSNITVKSVCKILQLADMHSDEDLYQSALEYFSSHAQKVLSTDEWKEISKNNLCAKLLKYMVVRKESTK